MSRQHSIVPHKSNYFFLPLEDDYLAMYEDLAQELDPIKAGKEEKLSGPSDCKAMIAAYLEHWMNSKRLTATCDDDFYTYLTIPEWEQALRYRYKRNMIIQCLQEMETEGQWTDTEGKHGEPMKRYTGTIKKRPYIQNTFEYCLNLPVLLALMAKLPEQSPFEKKARPSLGRPRKSSPKINGLKINGLKSDGISEKQSKNQPNNEEYSLKINGQQLKNKRYYGSKSASQAGSSAPLDYTQIPNTQTEKTQIVETVAREHAPNDSSSASAPDAHTQSQFDAQVLGRRIYEAGAQDPATLPPVMSAEDAFVATYQALVAQSPTERAHSARAALTTPQGDPHGHTDDLAHLAGHPLRDIHFLEKQENDRRGDQPALPTGRVGQVSPDRDRTDAHGSQAEAPPVEPSPITNPGNAPQATKPERPIATTGAPPARGDGYQKPEQQPRQATLLVVPAQPSARLEKPTMPPDDVKWCPETMVQLTEAKLGKRYRETTRDKQVNAARRILREDPELTREQYILAYDERDDDWWHEHKGPLHVNHMAEKDRVHAMLDRIEVNNARKSNANVRPLTPEQPTVLDVDKQVTWTRHKHPGRAIDHWYLYEIMPVHEALRYGWEQDAIVPNDKRNIRTRLKALNDGQCTLTPEQQAEVESCRVVA